MSVVVLGDANVDLEIVLPRDEASGGELANPDPRVFGGGSAANTAAALARLGVASRFIGSVGDDEHGRTAVASLNEAGVDTSGIVTTAGEPTVMVIAVIPPSGERLIYVWPPSGGAHRALTVDTAVAEIDGAEWVHVSGLCLRVSPAREAILAAMESARSRGIPVSFDLNLRLENWGWHNGFRSVVEAAVSHSDVVLGAARDEICALVGIDDPAEAARLLAGADRTVIARLGDRGALACTASTTVSVPSYTVDVVDTVGAGDAFNAGFITSTLTGSDLGTSVRWGNAVAGLAIEHPGARSTPTSAQVVALIDQP